MGILDVFSDFVEAVTPWSVVEAEAPADDSKGTSDDSESKDDDSKKDGEASDDGEDGGDEEEQEEEDDDEDDDDEPVDPKEQLEEECKESKQCAPVKHHFDECVERVQQQEADGEAKEDCVEEFFHLAHCASDCAAPKLWSKLR